MTGLAASRVAALPTKAKKTKAKKAKKAKKVKKVTCNTKKQKKKKACKAAPAAAAPVRSDPASTPGNTHVISPTSGLLSKFSKYSTLNAYTRDYYLIRGYMELFENTGGGTLILGPGTYQLSSTIYVPSHTTIVLSAGTTIRKITQTGTKKFTASDSLFMLVRPSLGKKRGAVGGHGGDTDITIQGAGAGQSVIDQGNVRNALGIIAGHNQRVTISGITFRNMNNNHFIEMDACADCRITGNSFEHAAPGTRLSAEAINLDTPDALTDGFGSIWSNLDGTPNVDVLIEGNTFSNLVRAIGTHNFTGGKYHTRVTVRNNTIDDMSNDAIRIMNWTDAVITGNTINKVHHDADVRGILASGMRNPTITGNAFSEMPRPIQFIPWANDGKAAVYGTTYSWISEANRAALAANSAGPGLREKLIRVAGVSQGANDAIWLAGHEPAAPPVYTPPASPEVPPVPPLVAPAPTPSAASSPDIYTSAVSGGFRVHVSSTGSELSEFHVAVYTDPAGVVLAQLPNNPLTVAAVLAINWQGGGLYTGAVDVTGLPAGEYYVRVTVRCPYGDAANSVPSKATVAAAPPPPRQLAATPGNGFSDPLLTWTPGAHNAQAPTLGYRLYVYSDAAGTVLDHLDGTYPKDLYATSASLSGVGVRRVWVKVVALNSVGESQPTALLAVNPPRV